MSFPWCCHTTLINRTELGKFGLFFMFLMTADSTICPPHSIIRLGEDTAASWYGFMFLRPHARICTHIEDVLKHMACLPSDQLWGSGFLPLESMETPFYCKQCKYIKLNWSELKSLYYLHSSELNHRPNALRNHIEVLGSFWRNQRKIYFTRLRRERVHEAAAIKIAMKLKQYAVHIKHSCLVF